MCYFLSVESKYANYCASFKILEYYRTELRNWCTVGQWQSLCKGWNMLLSTLLSNTSSVCLSLMVFHVFMFNKVHNQNLLHCWLVFVLWALSSINLYLHSFCTTVDVQVFWWQHWLHFLADHGILWWTTVGGCRRYISCRLCLGEFYSVQTDQLQEQPWWQQLTVQVSQFVF